MMNEPLIAQNLEYRAPGGRREEKAARRRSAALGVAFASNPLWSPVPGQRLGFSGLAGFSIFSIFSGFSALATLSLSALSGFPATRSVAFSARFTPPTPCPALTP